MTWRRFMVLVRGLGPHSATATRLASARYMGSNRGVAVHESASPQESENVLARMMGLKPRKVN